MEFLHRRTDDLIVQHLGDEVVIYDEQSHFAFCLSPSAKAVWLLCDGAAREIVTRRAGVELGLTTAATAEVLRDLERCGALVCRIAGGHEPLSQAAQHSRRAILSKLATGSMLAVPLVAAIVAPPAALAYTGCKLGVGGLCVVNGTVTSQAAQARARRQSSD